MKKKKQIIRIIFLSIIGIFILIICFFLWDKLSQQPVRRSRGSLANPASVNCEEQGGVSEIKKQADASEYGVCVFPGGYTCEEWQFFRGECSKPLMNAKTDTVILYNPKQETCSPVPFSFSSNSHPDFNRSVFTWQTVNRKSTSLGSGQQVIQIGLHNAYGAKNNVFPVIISVTTPERVLSFAEKTISGANWLYVSYPKDFTGGSLIHPGIYTVVYQIYDAYVACNGFVVE